MIAIGKKVEYKTTDAKGAETWHTGVVHGIRKAEAVSGPDIVLGYLVDTGDDEHLSEWETDQRDDEINARINKKLKGTETTDEVNEIVEKIANAKDLPKSKKVKHSVRQPVQVDVLPDDIRAVK